MAKVDRYALGDALAEGGIAPRHSTEDLGADLHWADPFDFEGSNATGASPFSCRVGAGN